LRGKGVHDLRTGRAGDQVVRVVVETPTQLNKKQRKLLEDYVDLEEESADSMVAKFSRKVRDLFGG
jgi:molecular chaperone DnaJ